MMDLIGASIDESIATLTSMKAQFQIFRSMYHEFKTDTLPYDAAKADKWESTTKKHWDENDWDALFFTGWDADEIYFQVDFIALKSYRKWCAVWSLQSAWRKRILRHARQTIEDFLITYVIYGPGGVTERKAKQQFQSFSQSLL